MAYLETSVFTYAFHCTNCCISALFHLSKRFDWSLSLVGLDWRNAFLRRTSSDWLLARLCMHRLCWQTLFCSCCFLKFLFYESILKRSLKKGTSMLYSLAWWIWERSIEKEKELDTSNTKPSNPKISFDSSACILLPSPPNIHPSPYPFYSHFPPFFGKEKKKRER